jgi:hypothetical protein
MLGRGKDRRALRAKYGSVAERRPAALLSVILHFLVAPFIMLAAIVATSVVPGRRHVVSVLIMLMAAVGFSWAGSFVVDGWMDNNLEALSRYDEALIEVRDIPFADVINLEAVRAGVDPALIAAMVSQQSGWQAENVSWRGGRGLMNVTPSVWRQFNPDAECAGEHAPPKCGDVCIYDVELNLRTGASYLRNVIDMYGGRITVALAAYASGIDYVEAFEAAGGDGEPPAPAFSEYYGTLRQVLTFWREARSAKGSNDVAAALRLMDMRRVTGYVALSLAGLLLLWAAVRYRPGA